MHSHRFNQVLQLDIQGTPQAWITLEAAATHVARGAVVWSENSAPLAVLRGGFNVPLGPFLATVGGKGIYTNPNDGDEGYAAAVGGGLQWKIGDSFGLFGEYYYSPDSLSSGIESYEEANAGARWTIMRPITIEAGYRYLNLAGKDGNRDNALADGPYVGVSAGF